METIVYILKSAGILSLFYVVYFAVLRKDTFFSINRQYLIGGIIASLLLPLLVFTKTIYVNAPVINSLQYINPISLPNSTIHDSSYVIDWLKIGIFIYIIGALYMSLRFLKQLFSLYNLLRKYPSYKSNGFRFIKVDSDTAPFSFFKYIVYNPKLHTSADLKMILKHEQTHASQLHSIDVILSNFLLIIQWINPIAWLYKKSIEENLEFIADSETVVQVPSKKEYQLTLVKVLSSNTLQPVLTSNFYQSLIKKRIIMLHKKSSKTQNKWKLLLILPLLGVFLWSFNVEEEIKYNDYSSSEAFIETSAEIPLVKKEVLLPLNSEKKTFSKKQIKPDNKKDISFLSEKKNNKIIDNKITVTVDKNTSDAELEKLKTLFKDTYKVTLKFSGVKRNSAGEIIKIKVSMKSNSSNASFNQDDTDGISEFIISYDDESGSISIGNGNKHDLHFISKKGNSFVYEIDEDEHGNIKKWVSKDGNKIKSGKHEIIIHGNDEHNEHGNVLYFNSGSGKNSNIWISKDKDGHKIKKGYHSIIIESDGDEDGNVFFYNSDDDEDSIFIHKADDKGFFFVGNDGKEPLVFIDGKKSSKKEMEKLDSDAIKNIEILKRR